jgi:hypothetical protein
MEYFFYGSVLFAFIGVVFMAASASRPSPLDGTWEALVGVVLLVVALICLILSKVGA